MCSTNEDFDILARRTVDLATDTKFVTFYRPDLDIAPREANGVIKPFDYPMRAGHRNNAYAMDSQGTERVQPPATVVVTATKAECKAMREELMKRADYKALLTGTDLSRAHGYRRQGHVLDAQGLWFKGAEAYAFRCAQNHL